MFESRKGNRDSRIDFERELSILGENLENGRIKISTHMKKNAHDLTKVRYTPNRRVDLNTISEMVRTLAMSVNFPHRDMLSSELEKETEDE
ncbi:hypothetical protein [Elizabethkingia sp. JS20170427COW]|uniref:hypothetical protein n=1 Tax=Elizabethkingia sp. JS20170427COW TaxID=2583851 RepID=UPI001110CDAC|nr:hypothetical protein [Elizabethkingia sp. JS20170427COW]QCX53636.1 hypothetical protein FGE20_07780 [Elizabethkingia sp. JS20170427COW]